MAGGRRNKNVVVSPHKGEYTHELERLGQGEGWGGQAPCPTHTEGRGGRGPIIFMFTIRAAHTQNKAMKSPHYLMVFNTGHFVRNG